MLGSILLLQATETTTTTAQTVGAPVTAYWPVMIFFLFAIIFPVLPIILGRFLRPMKYLKAKMRPYECGIDPQTEAHDRFTVRYYIVAMLFLIFDVETIFLLPWAIIFMGNDFSFTKFALIEMFVFIAILIIGYYYAWRKGALEWA
ncbi:MAG TPA: NADH-quinone oxidoreductase subunit A [Pyrinomonadaceae bacterium]